MKKLIVIFIGIVTSLLVLADRYASLEVFAQALNIIDKHYIRKISIDTLVEGAIKGLLREVDQHSRFFSPKNFKKIKDKTEGHFYGVGIEVDKKEQDLIIISVLKNSSADKAGLKQGDKLISVNGVAVSQWTEGDLIEIFENKKRTYTLVVKRGENPKSFTYKVRPSRVRVSSVLFEKIEDQFFYLRIYYFSSKTLWEIHKAFKGKTINGLILDLRSNPGGSLDQAVQVADLFLNKGVIVSYKLRNQIQPKEFKARFSNTIGQFPLVVLIDEYSASASEIVSGALKDHKRALLMGRKTFGKGTIQTLFPIKNKYALKLTVGEYQTPSQKKIHNQGIKPDITLPAPQNRQTSFKKILEDPEITKAFEHLKKQSSQT